jgi:glycosyltransferase involved in cell wall biosynthesis
MNIVINASLLLSPPMGMGRYVYRAAHALLQADRRNRYTFYYGYLSDELISPTAAEAGASKRFGALRRAKAVIDSIPAARAAARQLAHGYHRLATRSRRFDLYWEPNYIPIDIRSARVVTTVHDLSFHVHPEWQPRDRAAYFAKHFFRRLGRSQVVTTDSEFTRRELLGLVKMDERKVRVVYPGCDSSVFRGRPAEEVARFRKTHGLDRDFVLCVGSIEPRKNLDRLLDAWSQLNATLRKDFALVLVGFSGWRNESTLRRIARMKDDVTFLGYLDLDDLALCYNAATLFVYPSLYEGFGLPPLEALASGCPVLASDIPPLREVCSDSAMLVDPLDVDEISAGIEKLLTDEGVRTLLSRKGPLRAKAFTWESTAEGLLNIFDELAPASDR